MDEMLISLEQYQKELVIKALISYSQSLNDGVEITKCNNVLNDLKSLHCVNVEITGESSGESSVFCSTSALKKLHGIASECSRESHYEELRINSTRLS